MTMPGLPEMMIILAVVVLLFGAKKLPQLGGAIGESIKNFKKGVKDNEQKALNEDDKKNDESN
tara:strand:+ start:130 stop:318 length:189 start_codon:yes stop_codon:yes gene_type:complete